MELKTLIESEKQYYKLFFIQFSVQEHAKLAWTIIDKPESYPCVVIKSCGRYIYVYPEDFPTVN